MAYRQFNVSVFITGFLKIEHVNVGNWDVDISDVAGEYQAWKNLFLMQQAPLRIFTLRMDLLQARSNSHIVYIPRSCRSA